MKRYNLEDNAPLFEAFKTKNDPIIAIYYKGLKSEFIKNLRTRYNCIPPDYLDDIYQDSFIELGEQIISGKLTEEKLTVPIGAYLYGIGKIIAHNYVKNEEVVLDDVDTMHVTDNHSLFTKDDRELIREYVERIAEPCLSVLRMFYFEEYTMFSIAKLMKYKSEDVAKTRKNKCMTRLKEMIKNELYGRFDANGNN